MDETNRAEGGQEPAHGAQQALARPRADEEAVPGHPTRAQWLLLFGVLAATAGYAVLRYNVAKGVAWSDLPLYVGNKVTAWSAVLLFAVGAWRGWGERRPAAGRGEARTAAAARRGAGFEGRWAARLAFLHVLLSLAQFEAARYPALFVGAAQPSWRGGLAVVAGAAAVVAAGAPAARAAGPAVPSRRSGIPWVAAMVAAHTFLLGFPSWFAPASWPWGLVPITLLSFVAALAWLGFAWRRG